MAANDVKTVTVNIGAYDGSTIYPVIFFDELAGDITILDAKISGTAAGTSIGLGLYSATNVGTPAVSGTIGSFAGTIVYAKGVAFDCTISSATFDVSTSGQWLCVDQTSGTAPATTWLTVNYIHGK